jgi:hypothetical protein
MSENRGRGKEEASSKLPEVVFIVIINTFYSPWGRHRP